MSKKITYQDFKANQHPEFDFDAKEAGRLRDEGIDRAVKKADKDNPGWSDRVYKYFVEVFLRDHNGYFMAEQFRQFCASTDFDLPDNMRAFGGIMLRAKHAGVIKKVGSKETRMPRSHGTPATLWIQVKPSERK